MEWHHFDPPWREKEHHNPDGMIALCSAHHPQADGGAYTVEQLHKLKADAAAHSGHVEAALQWMRNRLLVCVGGNCYYEADFVFQHGGHPIIWFTRDEDGYMLLNVTSMSKLPDPRFRIEENFWTVHGNQEDLECPPSGKLVHVKYPNGDEFKVEFLELVDRAAVLKHCPHASTKMLDKISTPVTAVDILFRVANSPVDFGPEYSKLPGGGMMTGVFVWGVHGKAALTAD